MVKAYPFIDSYPLDPMASRMNAAITNGPVLGIPLNKNRRMAMANVKTDAAIADLYKIDFSTGKFLYQQFNEF